MNIIDELRRQENLSDTRVKGNLTGLTKQDVDLEGQMIIALCLTNDGEHTGVNQVVYGVSDLSTLVAALTAMDEMKKELLDTIRNNYGQEAMNEVIHYLLAEAIKGAADGLTR